MSADPIRYRTHKEDRSHRDTMQVFHRRDKVIKTVGLDSLEAFEMWAFPHCPHDMIYNDQIQFHWANGHSTKGIPSDPDQAIDAILTIWRSRFASDASASHEEIFTLELEDTK